MVSRQLGWVVRPEISFTVEGERGVIDLVAWHAAARALLVIELKTDIVDVGELLGTFGSQTPTGAWVGACLPIDGGRANRGRSPAVADAARVRNARGRPATPLWLAAPSGPLGAIAFMPDRQDAKARQRLATVRRVRPLNGARRPGSSERGPRSGGGPDGVSAAGRRSTALADAG